MKKVVDMKVGWLLLLIIFIFLTLPIANLASNHPSVQHCLVQNNWKILFNKNGLSVYSQKAVDSDVSALKATGILKAPIDQVMEVLRKVEISREWIPHIDKKISIRDFSDLEAITYSVNRLPWPFADRSLLLHNKIRLDKENRYLVVEMNSVDSETNPIQEDHVRSNLYCGQLIMRPAGIGQTEIELVLFVDPKGHIPAWLVNMSQKTMPYEFLKALEEKASRTNYELRPSFKEMLDQLFALLRN
jgi:hypothetical protein